MKNPNSANEPPSQVSDETDQNQLEMAKAEGAAYQKSLDYMVKEVADTGDKQRTGDYIVGFGQFCVASGGVPLRPQP